VMNDESKNVKQVFAEALEKSIEERPAYLNEACSEDADLRAEVEELLKAHEQAGDFMEAPAIEAEVTLEDTAPTEGHGTVIGRYKLLEKIGEGGFGVVWAAEQKKPVKRRVALKIIKLGMDTKQVVARFEAERQALALMDHPNIAKVLDAGSTDTGRPYFVMELVRGIPITNYCDQVKLSTQDRLDLFIKVCNAVQHAHQKGIIHRDIKPSNILVTLHDGVPVPRIIDFGIAKATQQELTEMTIYTQHHQFIGTPAYMSPEQAEMSGLDIDTRSDIYSLGVLLYELLTGRTPFDEKELMQSGIDQMRKIIREQEPPKPSTKFATLQLKEQSTTAARHSTDSPRLISLIRGDLDWIVMKCLEKNRTRRYDTTNGLALDVARHLSNEPVVARPPTAVYRLQKAWRRNKVVYTAAGMVLASLIIGISLSIWQAWVATGARLDAEEARAAESALREEAQEEEREQRLNAYAADMNLAQRYLNENSLSEVKELLDRYRNEEDVRGIYWRHLDDVIKDDESHTFPHETMVRSISLSADGARLASNTMSGRVRLYDVDSRKLLWEYGGGHMSHGAQDGSVALSPDGRLLAADQQGTLKVWDAESEELVFSQEHVVAPICFADSQSLVGVTETGLHIWNTADWTNRKLTGDVLGVPDIQFSALTCTPDSSRLIFSPTRFASKLIVYSLATGTVEGELTGLDRPSVISTDGSLVAAGGWGGYVSVWNLTSFERVTQFKAHSSIVLGVALSPDGRTLVTGGNDSTIKMWDTETFSVKRSLKGHHSQIWNLKFSGDGRYLASASMDQSVKLWAWDSVGGRTQDSPDADKLETEPVIPDTRVRSRKVAGAEDTFRQGGPKTHTVTPGDSIQAAIDAAAPGDRIDIAAGTHQITEMIVVDKPVVIGTVAGKEAKEPLPTILKGATGLHFVIQIQTQMASPSVMRDLQIEANASGIQHVSGALELRHCRVTIRSAFDFTSAISLEAEPPGDSLAHTVTVDGCTLLAEYAGDTIEGTPPDVDVILASSGSRYEEISITDSQIINDVPNRISNGIETRSTTAHMTIDDNHIHSQGIGIVMPNHIGAVGIRGNTVWSGGNGISIGNNSQERSHIIGNHITIDDQGLQVYPLFLKNYIASSASMCIGIGNTSAGVTAGFFLKEVIGRGTNFLVEKNVLAGNPKYGIALIDSPDPENYGPPTPNSSHENIFTQNDFTDLNAERDIALGASTFDNVFLNNVGVESVFREAGDDDRNNIRPE
ncbi:MAG: protein kinase domain-containing protein, partial [Planctomycetota bacterium]